jgi:dTDP-4-dehydrorhamnose reductase
MTATAAQDLPEIWGGLECTVARLRNKWRDQSTETGHRDRPEDLEAIAALGLRTLRYPVLWETISPDRADRADFSWHDPRLQRLRDLGIDPIAGLVHHGSGPRYTHLLDPFFPEMLAQHAERVAQRYPWIKRFTPVNEPLTTARFSGLYGHWYPHKRDYRSFSRALVNQCRAVVLSMQAIRAVTPDAELIQTEDLGKSFSTPLLQYQADHENTRRWLTFDLLLGRVDQSHPWFELFLRNGISEAELRAFVDEPCPPDVLGINHYLTSERFLDHRRAERPAGHRTGGNGRHRYADLEAVRVPLPPGTIGPEARLLEVLERYKLPVAITEVHHGCSRDEQLRWLMEVWNAARRLKEQGHDLRAVTVWALFGSVDWNSLLTRREGLYEPGAYDVSGLTPRLTALGRATQELARGATFDHPVLDVPGWWKREQRFYKPEVAAAPRTPEHARKLLITGANGTLGKALSRIAAVRGLDHVLLNRSELDIADPSSVRDALRRHQPWAVVNAAGYVRVADAERERDLCWRENVTGAAVLAEACAASELQLVSVSSDLVFSGSGSAIWTERDAVQPRGAYGESKAEAERRILNAHPQALVIRTSAFFGPWDRYNFVYKTLEELAAGRSVTLSRNIVSPTYVPDLAHAMFDLLIDGEEGIWHLANRGSLSWYELGRMVAQRGGVDPGLVLAGSSDQPTTTTALASERGQLMPSLESALDRFFRDRALDPNSDAAFRKLQELPERARAISQPKASGAMNLIESVV